MNIKDFFKPKRSRGTEPTAVQQEPQALRIEGVPEAAMTAEPDDAELAAAALLELLVSSDKIQVSSSKCGKHHKDKPGTENLKPETRNLKSETRDAAYYRHLAAKIRQARQAQRLRTVRFVAFCEQELKNRHLPAYGDGSLGLLEAELLKRLDIIEREGGELKRRWQHCLANVTIRLMKAQANGAVDPHEPKEDAGHTDSTDNTDNTGGGTPPERV